MARFLYAYRLTIGKAISPKKALNRSGSGQPFKYIIDYSTYLPKESTTDQNNAFQFSDLQISFNISKDDSAEPNQSTITLYNLSDDTVNYLNSYLKEKVVVKLEAGYVGEELKQLCLSIVDHIVDKQDGATRKTELSLADGTANTKEAITSRTYARGVPYSIIRKDLIKDLGLPQGPSSDWATTDKTLVSRSMTGNTHQLLKTLCDMKDSDYHIQDGKVSIIQKGKRLTAQSAYISPDTGLIGSPEPLGKDVESKNIIGSSAKQVTPDGIKFKCQLDGGIFVGSTVYVKSKNYDGAYKVTKLTHNGDFYGGQWTTEVEAIKVEATIGD